jgi:hypothetical protein
MKPVQFKFKWEEKIEVKELFLQIFLLGIWKQNERKFFPLSTFELQEKPENERVFVEILANFFFIRISSHDSFSFTLIKSRGLSQNTLGISCPCCSGDFNYPNKSACCFSFPSLKTLLVA